MLAAVLLSVLPFVFTVIIGIYLILTAEKIKNKKTEKISKGDLERQSFAWQAYYNYPGGYYYGYGGYQQNYRWYQQR